MLRFAPSPTGDMQIGDLRIALFNSLMSRRRNEPLVVRIEDRDKERNIEGKDKEIVEILGLFGIAYIDVVYQSNNLRFHRAMAIQLLQDKKAFNCFCTPEELDRKRILAKEQCKPFRYDDTCTHLPPEATIDNENPFTVRLKRPETPIIVNDMIQGKTTFDPMDIDSFIILNAEKYPTYDFACAVDDMLSDISLVIRAEKHFSDTPKQIAVRSALEYDRQIEYAHVPDMLDHEGRKMDGHDDATSVKRLLSDGFLPAAIANYLVRIGNETPQEIFTMDEAAEWFDLEKISKAPERFDIEALRAVNREHLKRMDDKELSRYVGFADDAIGKLAKLYLEEVCTTKELKAKIAAVFAEKTVPADCEESAATIKAAIKAAPFFNEFDAFKKHLVETTGLGDKQLCTPLRILLTGSEHGPDLGAVYQHIKNYLGEIVK